MGMNNLLDDVTSCLTSPCCKQATDDRQEMVFWGGWREWGGAVFLLFAGDVPRCSPFLPFIQSSLFLSATKTSVRQHLSDLQHPPVATDKNISTSVLFPFDTAVLSRSSGFLQLLFAGVEI